MTFMQWLSKQKRRADPVGDLAIDATADKRRFFARFDRPDSKTARKVQEKTERIQRAILEVFDEQEPPMSVRQGVIVRENSTFAGSVGYCGNPAFNLVAAVFRQAVKDAAAGDRGAKKFLQDTGVDKDFRRYLIQNGTKGDNKKRINAGATKSRGCTADDRDNHRSGKGGRKRPSDAAPLAGRSSLPGGAERGRKRSVGGVVPSSGDAGRIGGGGAH